MLRLAMATTAQLGYDLSVRRRGFSQKTQGPSVADIYDIDVCDALTNAVRTFRTKDSEVLYVRGTERILSRGTRIWKVNEVVDGVVGESTFVLKDLWLEHQPTRSLLEGDACGRISSFISEHPELEEFRSNFPSVETHGPVPDGDTDTLHHNIIPQRHFRGIGGSTDENAGGPTYERRVRYRIVYREVGVPVHKLESDDGAFVAISGAVRGMAFGLVRSPVQN